MFLPTLLLQTAVVPAKQAFWARYFWWLFPSGSKGRAFFYEDGENWFDSVTEMGGKPSKYFALEVFCFVLGNVVRLAVEKLKFGRAWLSLGRVQHHKTQTLVNKCSQLSWFAVVTAIIRALFLKKCESEVVVLVSVCLSLHGQTFRAYTRLVKWSKLFYLFLTKFSLTLGALVPKLLLVSLLRCPRHLLSDCFKVLWE